ncbi:hypothetical protein O181_056072 [Austropuccinia psidii MF-1]|uniref:Uncharacterized protein n=1 Tax=Austropuccinia psidii MF-1 TaxID=1389203 RepID=A0A9Q3HU40_9BASI|nr:hypothetical protein [Austropuccinia psidii MF-1]
MNNIPRAQMEIYMTKQKLYYTVFKEKDWEILPQIHQGAMNTWKNLKSFLKEEEIVKYANGWNPLSSKPQIKKMKELHKKKKEANKEEAQVASTRKPQANQPPQEGKKNKKKKQRKPYFSSYRIPRIKKDAMDKALMEFKGKEELIMRQPSFPKNTLCLLML